MSAGASVFSKLGNRTQSSECRGFSGESVKEGVDRIESDTPIDFQAQERGRFLNDAVTPT